MRALLASPYGPYAAGLLSLAAVATGVYLGAAWDRLTTRARAAVTAYRTEPTGGHRQ